MKKKYSIEEIEKSTENLVNPETAKNGKTPLSFSKKKKRKRIKWIIISVIAAIIIGAIGWFGVVSYNALKNIFNGQGFSVLNLLDTKELKGESSGRVNILLMGIGGGTHDGADLTDTMMIISLDTKNKQVAMISIPRDLYAKIGNYGYSKINAANAYGKMYKYDGGGPKLAEETVSKVVDQPIHYYALVDFEGFKKIIDIVGGIDVYVDKDLYDPLYPDGTFSIKKGQYHMNGDLALKYSRSRETTSDFDRAKRQQTILVATKEKILSTQTLLNPVKITSIISALGDHIKTDMNINEGQRVIDYAKKIDNSKIINKVFDTSANGLLVNESDPAAGYILVPRIGIGNYKEIQDAVKNIFSESRLAGESATIAVLNGTTKSGLALNLAERLKNQKFNVTYTGTADSSTYKKTVINDYTNGQKAATLDALKNLLNASVVTKQTQGSSDADIEIILGQDYVTSAN